MYGDAVLNYGGDLQNIPLLLTAILFGPTIITNLIPVLREKGIATVLGCINAVSIIFLAFSNIGLNNFEYMLKAFGEWITYDGHYGAAIPSIGLVLSGLILAVSVVVAHLIEKEKRYLALMAEQSN